MLNREVSRNTGILDLIVIVGRNFFAGLLFYSRSALGYILFLGKTVDEKI